MALAVLLVAATLTGLLFSVEREFNDNHTKMLEVVGALEAIEYGGRRVTTSVSEYAFFSLLTEHSSQAANEQTRRELNDGIQQLKLGLDRLNKAVDGAFLGKESLHSSVGLMVDRVIREATNFTTLVEDGAVERQKVIQKEHFGNVEQEFSVVLNEALADAAIALEKREIRLSAKISVVLVGIWIGTAAVAVVIVLLGRAITRSVVGPIQRLVEVSRAVADGDLSVRADVTSRDEFRYLGKSFNAMLLELGNTIALKEAAEASAVSAMTSANLANRAKSEFLANISHELRTPLNSVIGFSDMILSQAVGRISEQKYIDYAASINKSGRHLLDIIDEILDISVIETGRFELDETVFRLDEVIAQAIEACRNQTEHPDVKYSQDVCLDLPQLRADRRRVTQILMNLLGNSAKFTGSDGQVLVTASLDADFSIDLTVQDNGIGFAADDHERVLEPFGKLDSPLVSNSGGVGLGLNLVRSFVELHQGRFRIDSVQGEGTRVTVKFPPERTVKNGPEIAQEAAFW